MPARTLRAGGGIAVGDVDRHRRGGMRWTITKRQAFARDRATNAPCWICVAEGAEDPSIDYSLGYSTGPRAYEADHYIPVHDHPELEYDLANIRASHQACNRRRGKRASISLLGTPSRDWRRASRG